MGRKPTPKRSDGPGSPLDAQKRALAEKEAQLRDEVETQKRLIEEAPKLKAETDKRRREELVRRKSHTEARFGARGSLPDPRHPFNLNPGTVGRERKLRKHRRQGMWTFFVLCAILAGVLVWVYYSVLKP